MPDFSGLEQRPIGYVLVWAYQLKPSLITRHNDIWGDDTAALEGVRTHDGKTYISEVPAEIVQPPLTWFFAKVKD